MDRKTIFLIALAYLLVLLTLGLVFFIKRTFLFFLPDSFGPVAIGVPWFGALGAVLISLSGVFDHERDWDPDYWPWHIARPFIGVGLGVVSVIIAKAGVLAVGAIPPTQPEKITTNLLYYLIAFAVGYREETFRELLKRLLDVILTPGSGTGTGPKVSAVAPSSAPHNTSTPLVITGSGLTDTKSVTFGKDVAQFKVDSDSQLTVMTPTVPVSGAVTLTVTTKAGAATLQFTFT